MIYRIGEKVKVKKDLIVGNVYGSNSFVTSMADMRGKVVTITDMSAGEYHIKECGYWWTEEMLEPINLKKEVPAVKPKKPVKLKVDSDGMALYLTIENELTIALPLDCPVGVSRKHPDDKPSKEIGQAIAFRRMKMEEFEMEGFINE